MAAPSKLLIPRRLRLLAACSAVWLVLAAVAAEPAEPEGRAASGGDSASTAAGEPAPVLRVRIDSIIHPVSSEFLLDAVRQADEAGAAALVIELATPGGLLTSTREMFTAMLGAETPVVVYVSPQGAQAASAGFFLLMAADVAAMAPGTNTGAAHPVGGQGEDIEGTLGQKAEQDAAATIRSLAARHGRNAELAEAAVVESRSFTADEALEAGLVDLVVPSLPALLTAIDGREVEKGGRTLALATAEAPVRDLEMSGWRKALAALAHPNIAYILLSLGFLGLYFELMNPGAILPGVLGAISLILAFFALSVLPVNYAGVALIVLAVLLFIAEIKVTSFGLLTVGGVVALALGGLMLFKTPVPALRVSLELIAAVALVATVVVGALMWLALKARRGKVHGGSEGLVGERGRATTALGPETTGKVFVHGELWHARAAEPVAAGAVVEVLRVDGMTIDVRPAAVAPPAAGPTVPTGTRATAQAAPPQAGVVGSAPPSAAEPPQEPGAGGAATPAAAGR
jgi:membrane-bound serine protease (ClpP class)